MWPTPAPVAATAAGTGSAESEAGQEANEAAAADVDPTAPPGDMPEGALPGDIRDVLMQLAGRGGAGDAMDEEQLMDMLASMAEELTSQAGPGHSSRPPASKKVVASLPRVVLDDEQLKAMGPGANCPVCTEDFAVGDEVQKLPCQHVYHIPCLAPWLQQQNSCPICRHELPTDDHVYEARKEREKQEEEDKRGAENALSHNEFMYV